MNLQDAIKVLDQALQPNIINQLNRQDWFILHQAFETIKQYVASRELKNDADNGTVDK